MNMTDWTYMFLNLQDFSPLSSHSHYEKKTTIKLSGLSSLPCAGPEYGINYYY